MYHLHVPTPFPAALHVLQNRYAIVVIYRMCVLVFALFYVSYISSRRGGARNRMSTSDKVFSFTLSTARYKALPQPCAGTLDAPRICASITTSRSPLCLACRPSLDRSGELYTFDPKSNINQFPGCRKVRANCMVT